MIPMAAAYGNAGKMCIRDRREISSSIRDWQETADLLPFAFADTTTELRKVLIPPSLEIDLVFT